MGNSGLARTALVFLVLLLVTLGFLETGGPITGRAEKHDAVRGLDLANLSRQVECLADQNGGVLPETISDTVPCSNSHLGEDLRFEDPYTGAPYRYEAAPEGGFRLCADFDAPERFVSRGRDPFDASTGCFHFQSPA